MRVAVTQFATSSDVQENLAICMRMINEAVTSKASLIVLPEFCNTQCWYQDHNQAWNEALAIDGTFLQQIAAQAKQHDCYILLNVTLRRDIVRNHHDGSIKSNISVTSCLYSPQGKLIQEVDKQTLLGHENDFFISTRKTSEVVTTSFGKLGILNGCDDMTYSASRELSLNGAQLLCHSMNSFALDHSRLHGPTRAYENNVFLVSANKVDSLSSAEQCATLSTKSTIPQKNLISLGQSQIVSPEGKVLAKLSSNDEGVAFADIDLAKTTINKKCRPDGTELVQQLRPELYQDLTLLGQETAEHDDIDKVPVTVNVAIFATYKSNEQAIEDVCHYIENNLSDIIQLPELFFIADKKITHDAQQLALIACLSTQLIKQISSALRPLQYVCTSLVIDGVHQAVLINEHGLLATQQQLHFCQRYQWTALGDDLTIVELPLEQGNIKLAMLTADDANITEIVNIASLHGIHLLLVPFDIQEPCEVEYSLLSRAAENRICIVAASREKSFANNLPVASANNNPKNKNKIKPQKSTGLIANLTADSALLAQWKPPKFEGYINAPLVKHQHGKITKAVIHPIAACDKLMVRKNIG